MVNYSVSLSRVSYPSLSDGGCQGKLEAPSWKNQRQKCGLSPWATGWSRAMVECFPSWSSHRGLCTWENVNSWCVKSVRYWGCYSMNLKQEIKKTTKTAKPKGNGRGKEKSNEMENKESADSGTTVPSWAMEKPSGNWLPNPGLGPLSDALPSLHSIWKNILRVSYMKLNRLEYLFPVLPIGK